MKVIEYLDCFGLFEHLKKNTLALIDKSVNDCLGRDYMKDEVSEKDLEDMLRMNEGDEVYEDEEECGDNVEGQSIKI